MELNAMMKIGCTAQEAYEAFCSPDRIGNFWFSTSSARWEAGRTIRLTHKEYDADFDIIVLETVPGERIVYLWGDGPHQRQCTIAFLPQENGTVVKVTEANWRTDKDNTAELLQNQTGWVFMLTCLKAYLENQVNTLRNGLMMG